MLTQAIEVLYKAGDRVVLKLDPTQTGNVCRDQQPGAQHVYVLRANQHTSEMLRIEDVMPAGMRRQDV